MLAVDNSSSGTSMPLSNNIPTNVAARASKRVIRCVTRSSADDITRPGVAGAGGEAAVGGGPEAAAGGGVEMLLRPLSPSPSTSPSSLTAPRTTFLVCFWKKPSARPKSSGCFQTASSRNSDATAISPRLVKWWAAREECGSWSQGQATLAPTSLYMRLFKPPLA